MSRVLIVFSGLLTLLAACGGANAPEDLPEAYLEAVSQGDTGTLQELAAGKAREEGLKTAALAKDNNITISGLKVLSVKDAGENKKTVKVEYVNRTETKSGRGFPRSLKNFQTFHLSKSEQGWVIESITVDRPPVSAT
jgi:hypothetical protein